MTTTDFLLMVTLGVIGYFIYLPIYNYICFVLTIHKYAKFFKKNVKLEGMIMNNIVYAETKDEIRNAYKLINKLDKLLTKYENDKYLSSYVKTEKETLEAFKDLCYKKSILISLIKQEEEIVAN